MIPKKNEVLARARELFFKQSYHDGMENVNTPENAELVEDGFYQQAVSELMTGSERKYKQWLENSENMETSEFQFEAKEAMQTTCFISGSRGIGKSDVCMRIAEQLQNEGIIIIAFDPSMDWLKRSNIEKYITVKPFSNLPIPETSMIFDISRLTPLEAQRSVEQFCKKLFEFQLDNSMKRFYVIFEEAQIYFPLSALNSKRTQNSMRLLTVGRNFNISLAAISQFPALVSKELIKHSQQVWIGCCSEPNTLNYWKGILGKKAEDLKTLQNGQFIYYCRNKIGLMGIEPYETTIQKQQIAIPQCTSIEPIKRARSESTSITIARLLIVTIFAILTLKSF